MAFIEQQAEQYPDTKVQLAALKDRQDPAWGISETTRCCIGWTTGND
ncbi:MAG: hypothetical protein IKM83_06415 [Paludibacteraceae bacterium]|nr:hypothetical protein [Paludibacteraceae bacterium]